MVVFSFAFCLWKITSGNALLSAFARWESHDDDDLSTKILGLLFSSKMTTTLFCPCGDYDFGVYKRNSFTLVPKVYAIQNKHFNALCKHFHRNWFTKAHDYDVIQANSKQKEGASIN